jgi:hypothetical protein
MGATTACLLLALTTSLAHAQGGLSHLDDATGVPPGLFRLDAITAWTRYSSLFAGSGGGVVSLSAPYSSDSLGVAQLPRLANTQTAIQTLSGSPFHLSLGSIQTSAQARVVTTPVQVEYGLTRRWTLGVAVPFVRTRTTIFIRANPKGTEGNVGVNPASLNANALSSDSAVVAQFGAAVAALETTLQGCKGNALFDPGCATILAHQSDIGNLLQSATLYSATLGVVYGANAQVLGAPVVPVTGSATDLLIRSRIAQFDSSFHTYLSTAPSISARPAGALGVVGTVDWQSLVRDPAVAGVDSLGTTERINIGDVELSAKYLLHDGFADSSARAATWHSRTAITGTLRLGTGVTPSMSNPLDIGTGNGTTQVEGRLATVWQYGRHVGLSAAGLYAYSLSKGTGSEAALNYKPAAPSSYEVQLAPRWRVSDLFDISAAYGFRHIDAMTGSVPDMQLIAANLAGPVAYHDGVFTAAGNTQTVGLSVHYSSLSAFGRGGSALPIDIGFTHLEAITGAGAMPKTFRDQVEIRVYYRWRER